MAESALGAESASHAGFLSCTTLFHTQVYAGHSAMLFFRWPGAVVFYLRLLAHPQRGRSGERQNEWGQSKGVNTLWPLRSLLPSQSSHEL